MMGMFDSFLGQNDGYTKAQRTGLARSAEIKKKRKEEEMSLERDKMKLTASEAEKNRDSLFMTEQMKQLSETKGEGMKPQPESQYRLQQLRGEQVSALSAQEAEQTAVQTGMEARRRLTEFEVKEEREKGKKWMETESPEGDKVVFNPLTGETKYPGTPQGLGSVARSKLGETDDDSLLSKFNAMPDKQKETYMQTLKRDNPEEFLKLAKKYKAWYLTQ